MTTLGRREKSLRNRSEKRHFRALRAYQLRHRPLPAPLKTPWNQNRLRPCRGRSFGLYGELESERQNGNSVQMRVPEALSKLHKAVSEMSQIDFQKACAELNDKGAINLSDGAGLSGR